MYRRIDLLMQHLILVFSTLGRRLKEKNYKKLLINLNANKYKKNIKKYIFLYFQFKILYLKMSSTSPNWILISEANKNLTKKYITKMVLYTELEGITVKSFHNSSELCEYKNPLDAYNLVALDMNKMKNLQSYKLMVPEPNVNNIVLNLHNVKSEKEHYTFIYTIYNSNYDELKEIHKCLKNDYLHKVY
jgi:hypothetical protein